MQQDQASRISRSFIPEIFEKGLELNLSSIRPVMLLSFHFASIVGLYPFRSFSLVFTFLYGNRLSK